MKNVSIIIFFILLILIAGIYYWLSLFTHQPPKGIILISLDTLRADHLGCYGYHRETSLSIDAFAQESIVFENAVVQAPFTLPSHMSIMTSLYPSFHGVTNTSLSLAEEHTTLAELLQKNGYQTAAFTDGGQVNGIFGFDQGFDTYEDEWIGIAKILPKAEKWLDNNASNPFFLFIHCYDIHDPYNPPAPYNSIFHDDTYNSYLVPSSQILTAARKKHLTVNNEDIGHFISLYDGGIRYVDEKIGEFFSYLKDTGLYDQSLIIITSDHGEEFNEHGSFLHWQLYYDSNLHVPLIMRIPNYPKKEIRNKELVRSIDLLPTIADLTGLTVPPNAQGKSLLPLLKKNMNFFNQLRWRALQGDKRDFPVAIAENDIGEGLLWTVITPDGYQLIDYQNSQQMFNLESDPLAKTDILNDHSDIVEKLVLHYNKLYNTKPQPSTPGINLDKITRQQLEALGYVDLPEQLPSNSNDTDNDGIVNSKDNCPTFPNPEQEDTDRDMVGDDCDMCPGVVNPAQENRDRDWIGDACDECIDADWDGYGNPGFKNTCGEDNCPYLFNPSQKDSDNDGIGDACESSRLVDLWLEAEHANSIVSPLEITTDKAASGEKYIYAPNGTGDQYVPDSIMATYTVDIAQTGGYVLWGRVKVIDEKDNSFFIQIDNGSDYLWDIELGDQWHWGLVNHRDKAYPVVQGLTEGFHTIKVKLREDGTKLDKLLLTNKLDLIPE